MTQHYQGTTDPGRPGSGIDEGTTGFTAQPPFADEPAMTTGSYDPHTTGAPTSTGEQAKDVAKTATEQAKHVAQETGSQMRNLAGSATDELRGQAATQQERVASGLRTLADDLSSMRTGNGSDRMAGELMQEVSSRAHRAADWLEHREPGQLLDEVRDYARRHPGTFLLGALAAGLVVGRLTRGIVAAGGDGHRDVHLPAPAVPVADARTGMPGTGTGLGATTGHVTPDELAYSGGAGRYERESEVPR
ncbi:hypothetical protein ACFQY4_15475 [Catellatospora bangladeshensis]|uniref:Uncharacterized protein n=1 Tax=Catellatospora bangladeshensis TaxID=310355 RepID=A0A8J3JDM9_9ACTN|nr:hypothetical protein [Catellatospora bangladeshensis]GIF82997.1 hypothetical protein Cba03nite_43460 [Catellatospora bangladeshensis]